MTTQASDFATLQDTIAREGTAAALDELADMLRRDERFHELFEVLKMQARSRLELQPVPLGDPEELSEGDREQLEDELLDACREVGEALLKRGKIQEGWMYLRPLGEVQSAARLLADVEVGDDNIDEMIGVTLSEGVDAERGFSLVLDHYGTCNAITTFDSEIARRDVEVQKSCAGMLVRHLHRELRTNVAGDIERREGTAPNEETLIEMVASRPELFEGDAYHIDTTHLASVVRFARVLDDQELLELAIDLTEYGRRLSDQYQYSGDEPFQDVYPSHALYLSAVRGTDVDQAIEFFRDKAQSVDRQTYGTIAVEVFVELLARVNRLEDAIDVVIEHLAGERTMGIAPSLVELCAAAGRFDRLLEFCRQKDDLLGFGTGLILSQQDG